MQKLPVRLLQSIVALAAAFGLWMSQPAQANPLEVIVAGAPKDLVSGQNYQSLFTTLRQNGISGFFPTFQYQEVPRPVSFGYESDFSVPCSRNDRAFKALRATGMKLILPAELVYPSAGQLKNPSSQNDPLRQLIDCAGRDRIAAITNYDEAAFHGISENNVKRLFNHVNAIDPSLPVLMVHGPIVTDKPQFKSASKRKAYLKNVVSYSRFADVVGFDVYPVPALVAKSATPLSNGNIVGASQAVKGYTTWLKSSLPNKRKLMVLQGFAYSDMYEPNYLRRNFPAELINLVKPPNRKQLDLMVSQAREDGVEMIIWWGQAALENAKQRPWPDILWIGRKYGY